MFLLLVVYVVASERWGDIYTSWIGALAGFGDFGEGGIFLSNES